MKAVVLVGGEGTRLRPLTYTTPKQLLPIAEVALIERVLAWLAHYDVDRVVLSLGYRPDAFIEAYPAGFAAGVAIEYAVEPHPLDTAGAIRFAAEAAGIKETFLVVNGDVLTDFDVRDLIGTHRRAGALGTIGLTPAGDPSRFGVVPTDDDGRVLAFVEKPPPGEAPTNMINAGIYVLEPEVLAMIDSGRKVSIERETFPALVETGRLFAAGSGAYWLDTGTPEAYLQAQVDVLSGRRGPNPTPGAELYSPGVWTVGNVTLTGTVKALSLIGSGAVIERDATVIASVVGADCKISTGAVVERSVLLRGVRVGPGAVVRDSIIGAEASLGRDSTVVETSIVGDGGHVDAGKHLSGARFPEFVQEAQ